MAPLLRREIDSRLRRKSVRPKMETTAFQANYPLNETNPTAPRVQEHYDTRSASRLSLCEGSSRNQKAKNGQASDRNWAAPLKLRNFPCTQPCSVAEK